MAAIGGRGGKGGDLKGVEHLGALPRDGPVIQIPEDGYIYSVWWLGGRGPKPANGSDSLAYNVNNPEHRGGESTGVWILFKYVVESVFLFGA